jgi:hypothetical protein
MLEVMKFKNSIEHAVEASGCRFQSVSEAQHGSGWKRCRVDYQRPTGRRERVFIYLFEKSSELSVGEDVLRAIKYQEELSTVMSNGMAESA